MNLHNLLTESDSMAGTWSVVQCPACRNCHGTRGQPRQCPHCGQSLPSTTPILATAETSAQLRIEVALANTPEELRDELRKKLEQMDEPLIASSSSSPPLSSPPNQGAEEHEAILHRFTTLSLPPLAISWSWKGLYLQHQTYKKRKGEFINKSNGFLKVVLSIWQRNEKA